MKNKIKIPNNTVILYDQKKKTLTVIGPSKKKTLYLKVKLLFVKTKNVIIVKSQSFKNQSNINKKKIKVFKGTTISLIRQLLVETSSTIYKKLIFKGIGYRAFILENFKNELIMLKLGLSHSLYVRKPNNLNICCLKQTKLFIYGNSYQSLTNAASTLRSYKIPEPYKGKGILYENEKIILKEGKKI